MCDRSRLPPPPLLCCLLPAPLTPITTLIYRGCKCLYCPQLAWVIDRKAGEGAWRLVFTCLASCLPYPGFSRALLLPSSICLPSAVWLIPCTCLLPCNPLSTLRLGLLPCTVSSLSCINSPLYHLSFPMHLSSTMHYLSHYPLLGSSSHPILSLP